MPSLRKTAPIAVALLVLGGGAALAQSGHDLFQQALTQERVYGNLEQAVRLYQRIATEFPKDRVLSVRALVQLGGAYEKLGSSAASTAYRRVVREFADQSEQVRVARGRLRAVSARGERRNGALGSHPTYTLVFDDLPVGIPGSPAPYDFSPDGRQLVFRDYIPGERPPGLYLSQRDATTARPLIILDSARGPTEGLWNPRWSPDGERIAFTAHFPERDRLMGLYVIDVDGGAVERIADSFEGDLCWTPDGLGLTHVGFDRRLHKQDLTGRTDETALGGPLPQNTLLGGYSPDGRWLALDIRTERLGREMRDIWIMPADGGERFYVTDAQGLDASPAWGADGGLYFVSDRSGNANIWRLGMNVITGRRYPTLRGRSGLPSGRGRGTGRVTSLAGSAEQVTFFEDSRVVYHRGAAGGGVAFVLQSVTGAIRLADVGSPRESRIVARGSNPQLSPGGDRVFFEIEGTGQGGVVAVSRDGGRPVRLIRDLTPAGRGASRFHVSPDGTALVYADDARQGWTVFTVRTGGGARRPVTSIPGNDASYPVWSPDGDRIAFASGRGLYVVSRDGGRRTRLAELRTWDAWSVRWSPDGEYLAALGWEELSGPVEPRNHVYVVRASGGELRRLTPDDERQYKEGLEWHPNGEELTYMYHAADFEGDGLRTAYLDGRPSRAFIDEPATWDYIGVWAPDGSAYYFLASDGARPGWQLYRRDVGTEDITELFAGDEVSLPQFSRDGTTMAWSVRQVESQLWVMEFEQ